LTTTIFEKILKKMLLKVMFTVRNSRTGKENIKRERERRDDNFTWKTLSK